PLRAPQPPATTRSLALGRGLAATIHRRDGPTRRSPTNHPERLTRTVQWKSRADRRLNRAQRHHHRNEDQLQPITRLRGGAGLSWGRVGWRKAVEPGDGADDHGGGEAVDPDSGGTSVRSWLTR